MKCAFFAVLFLLLCGATAPAQERPPNIIIILTDDQGYGDVGFNGCDDIPTPGMDRIASNGVVFDAGYVSYAVCGPSRAGLLTGRYQDRFGFSRNPLLAPNDPAMGLPLSEQTMATLLKKAGYATAAFGKWHLGAHRTLYPDRRGFDEFYGFLSGGHRYFPEELVLNDVSELRAQYDGYKTKLLHNNRRVEENEYLTDAFSRQALAFIRANKDNPFFVYLAYNAPHAPLQAPEKYLKRFDHIKNKKRKTYAAMVSAVDDGINDVLDLLEELQLSGNTLVFFLSDNGGPIGPNGSSNKPLRGKKGDFFEGGIRVPFAVQWPGNIPAGVRYQAPVISLDIFATAAATAAVTPDNPIDGVNLIPFLKGENKGMPHDYLFWRNFDSNRFAVRSAAHKMILDDHRQQLYRIQEDISESNNTAADDRKTIIRLEKHLNRWKSSMMDPVFLGLLQDSLYSAQNPGRWK